MPTTIASMGVLIHSICSRPDDIGNFMATSLMGTCTENQDGGCPLGSLTYRGDFEPTATGCFGPGGSYRMAQLSSVWIFLAHNAGDEALDFMVRIACGPHLSIACRHLILHIEPGARQPGLGRLR